MLAVTGITYKSQRALMTGLLEAPPGYASTDSFPAFRGLRLYGLSSDEAREICC